MSKDIILSQKHIEIRIFNIREVQVMIDRDLAEMYQVETRVLNQAVKRNIERFPQQFRFQLSDDEKMELVTNCDRFDSLKHSSTNPYAFTEQGVAMLSAVLRSDIAVKVSIQIINAFIEMRKIIANHSGLLQRMEGVERKLLETDHKFEQIFDALENKDMIPSQGVFFDNQVFDAYELASKIIRSAKKQIVLIDNYINESTFTHLSKKKKGAKCIIFTKNPSNRIRLDLAKANEQYGDFEIKEFDKSHDRFLILDEETVYH
ncbi:MAG: ORF6N domain-containing protein, partial [Flavobacteriia bacterium]|nr:ORF6N domain-containing protein [Flavobacteriia bacterium]